MSALGCLLGAIAILITALKWTEVDNRQDTQALHSQRAICAIVVYAEQQAVKLASNPKVTKGAATNLLRLAEDMRATGVPCPHPPAPSR